MTSSGEFDDDRDDCRDCSCDECQDTPSDDAWRRPFGPGYVSALGAVADAAVTADALDRLLQLGDRWPEPRVLDQDEVFHLRDRTAVSLSGLSPGDAAGLLAHVRSLARELHATAVRDEALTTSTAMRWAMEQAGIPSVDDLDPSEWLESSVLVRALRETAEAGGPS